MPSGFCSSTPAAGAPSGRRRYPLKRGQWEAHLGFRRDGTLISSAQQGETLLWDARAGRIARRYPVGGRFDLSPDGRRLAVALNSPLPGEPSSSIGVLDLRTGRHTELAADLPDEWIFSLAFTRDGTRIVGATEMSPHVWEVDSGSVLETYGTRRGTGGAAAVDHRGMVLDGRTDGSISVWDPDGARRLGRRFRWTTAQKSCFANPCTVIDPRGAVMATSLGDGTVALVDLRSKRLIAVLPAVNGKSAEALTFTSGGRRLATGGIAGTVTIWEVGSRAVVRRLRFSEAVRAVAISPNDRLLAVELEGHGGRDSHVEVRDLGSGKTVGTHRLRFGLGDLAFTGDGRVLVAGSCCSGGSTVAGWDAGSGALLFESPPAERVLTFALSSDSQLIPAAPTMAV